MQRTSLTIVMNTENQSIPYNSYNNVKKENSWTAGEHYTYNSYNNSGYWSKNRELTT